VRETQATSFGSRGELEVTLEVRELLDLGRQHRGFDDLLAGVRGLEAIAVIGSRDERWGEVPMIATHSDHEVDIDALGARCELELAGYRQP
jgi:hypothetical protein